MSDDRFEDFVRREARDYHRPPDTPREEMWARIVSERQQRHGRQERRVFQVRWWGWAAAAAAVLAVGIGIGMNIGPRAPRPSGMQLAEVPGGAGQVPAAFEMVAQDHLRHVETFLTVFQTEARHGSVERMPGLARDLLQNTRLLMDSPVGQDAHMAALLDDIEIVLAQIASYAGRGDRSDLQLIDQAIEQRGLLMKLRAAVPAEYSVTNAQGVL